MNRNTIVGCKLDKEMKRRLKMNAGKNAGP